MDTNRISKLKQAARYLKRDTGLTHTEALDLIARREGVCDWAHLRRNVIDQPIATVTKLPIPKSKHWIFHAIKIEGMEFTAFVSEFDGLFLNGPQDQYGYVDGQVNLGVCRITHFPQLGEWWVCKYQDEHRINVTSLTDSGRLALAREFGLSVDLDNIDDNAEGFLDSPAFDALVEWIEQRPRLAKRAGTHSGAYIYGWYERAKKVLNG